MNFKKVKSFGIKSIVAGLALMIGQAFPALINVTPVSQDVLTGSDFTVDIMISDLGSNEDLGGFDIDLTYDNSVLELSGYELSDALGHFSLGEAMDISGESSSGLINLANLSLLDDLSSQSEKFKLATVTFKGIAEGVSELALSVNDLSDYFGEALDYTTQDGSVSVPEASTTMLLSGGLLLMSVVALRKKVIQ